VVATYVHNASSPELGKIGVLVALKSTADKTKLAGAGQAARDAYRGARRSR
jgi:elongation factor Ts